MTKSIPILAAAFLMTTIATPVFAQAAIQEPGAFAFYHPDADVLHAGRPAVPFGGSNAFASMIVARARHLVPSVTVPTIRPPVPTLAMTATGIPASDPV